MTIFLIILTIVLLLAMLRITVTIAFKNELTLHLKILCFKFRLFPAKKRRGPHKISQRKINKIKATLEKKAAKKREKALAKQKKKEEAKYPKPKSVLAKEEVGLITPKAIVKNLDVIMLLVTKFCKKFAKHSRIKLTRIRIKIACEDAAETAIMYSTVCASTNALLALLSNTKQFHKLKRTDINVTHDFLSSESEMDIKISYTLRLWHVFDLLICALVRLIAVWIKLMAYRDLQNSKNKSVPKQTNN